MRFLFYDRIVEMELGKRAVATRSVSIGDEFLPDHFTRKPLMPASLVLEAITQVAGWLYIATKDFGISTVLALAQGVQVPGKVTAGSVLQIEASFVLEHQEGATLRGSARSDGKTVVQVERLVFASKPLPRKTDSTRSRELFQYLSGGFQLNGRGVS